MPTMVAAVSANLNSKSTLQRGTHLQKPTRPPLLPSEPDNVMALRRPKSREVTSRYMSSSTPSTPASIPRRCPSPLVSRTPTAAAVKTPKTSALTASKRSQSVERNRNGTPRPNYLDFRTGNTVNNGDEGGGGGEMSSAQKMLLTSTRSLSVSFQGESFSLQVSKVKPTPLPTGRKETPERRKAVFPARGGGGSSDLSENTKAMIDQPRFPVRLGQGDFMSRSFDWMDGKEKLGTGSGNVVRALKNSMDNAGDAFDGRLNSTSGNTDLEHETDLVPDGNSGSGTDVQSDRLPSDAESASSESTSGCGGKGQRGPRGVVVPARFWQETNNRLKRQQDLGSSLSNYLEGPKPLSSSKLTTPKKLTIDCPASVTSPRGISNCRGQSSPKRGLLWPASPSRLSASSASSPSRGISPSRMRNAAANTPGTNLSNEFSILNFVTDVRKGKIGENQVANGHFLRLLHNRLLQWRFVNGKAEATLSAQRINAERSLYNAWISTSKLRESVRAKRYELQSLRRKLKLTSILNWQVVSLEDWDLLDQDFSTSLSGVTEALKASTLRLPVVGGAKGDLLQIKDAISSAVDIMQAMTSSICLLLSKVENVNSLALELTDVSARERALLYDCRDILSIIAAIQVKECSLRTHALQIERVPSSVA